MPDAPINPVLHLEHRHRAHSQRGRQDAQKTHHHARAPHRHRAPGRTPAQTHLCRSHTGRLAAIGVPIDERIVLLSTYLGHVSPAESYWYLTATPELMGLAAAGSTNSSEHAHEPSRAITAGVLHRPAAHPTPSEPEHDRRLPPHLPTAAAVRHRTDRHPAQRARHRHSSTRR